jgi:hypothetical protein
MNTCAKQGKKTSEVKRVIAAYNRGQNIFRRPSVSPLLKYISELETRNSEALAIALDELSDVQFCDNTYSQSIEAKREVEAIIRNLVTRLTPHAPDAASAAVKVGEPAPALSSVKPADSQAAPVM